MKKIFVVFRTRQTTKNVFKKSFLRKSFPLKTFSDRKHFISKLTEPKFVFDLFMNLDF